MTIFKNGQIPLWVAVIGALATIITGTVASRTTATSQVDEAVNSVRLDQKVLEERENNHYLEVKSTLEAQGRTLERIESKIDKAL